MLTVRQVRGDYVRPLAEADFLQQPLRWFTQLGVAPRVAPEAEAVARLCLDRKRHIVERGELRIDARDLERAREPLARASRRRERRDVLAGEDDAPGIRREVAGELSDEGRLAGAVRPD